MFTTGLNVSLREEFKEGATTIKIPESVVHSDKQSTKERKGIRITSTTKIAIKLFVEGRLTSGWRRGRIFRRVLRILPTTVLSTDYTVPFRGRMGLQLVGLKKLAS